VKLKVPPAPPADSPLWKLWETFVATPNRLLFRATGGRVGGSFGGAPILLLHTVGRKSGERRATPLLYLPDGERVVLVASKGGTNRHPAWYHNLLAAPETEVELPRQGRRRMRARLATDDERPDLWRRCVEIYPPYEDYQRRTSRRIPLIVLEPRE